MCDPISLGLMAAGTAASVVGSGINSREQADNNANIAEARNKALQETNAKNLAYAAKNRESLITQLANSTGAAADTGLNNAKTTAVQTIHDNMAPPTTGEPSLAGNAPTVSKSGLGSAIADAAAKSKEKAAAQGNLLGYTTFGRTLAEGDQNLAGNINTNNDYAHGNNAILPSLMDYEQIKANKPSSGLGELLQGLGGVASGYAGKRAGNQGFSIY